MNNNNKEMMNNIFTNFLFTNYNDHSVTIRTNYYVLNFEQIILFQRNGGHT
jgi:hypothetical protein